MALQPSAAFVAQMQKPTTDKYATVWIGLLQPSLARGPRVKPFRQGNYTHVFTVR